jgi:hypothetical protein
MRPRVKKMSVFVCIYALKILGVFLWSEVLYIFILIKPMYNNGTEIIIRVLEWVCLDQK